MKIKDISPPFPMPGVEMTGNFVEIEGDDSQQTICEHLRPLSAMNCGKNNKPVLTQLFIRVICVICGEPFCQSKFTSSALRAPPPEEDSRMIGRGW